MNSQVKLRRNLVHQKRILIRNGPQEKRAKKDDGRLNNCKESCEFVVSGRNNCITSRLRRAGLLVRRLQKIP